MVRVLFYAGVRERAGRFETRLNGFSGTLAELMKHLEERHGISLYDSSDMIFMVNGRHIAHIGGFDAPVSDGDVVSALPMVGGG